MFPVGLGPTFQLSSLYWVQPFVTLGGTVVGYVEKRTDRDEDQKGYSSGFYYSGGIAIPLDWISRRRAWNAYADSGVKNTFLTIESVSYTHLTLPTSG